MRLAGVGSGQLRLEAKQGSTIKSEPDRALERELQTLALGQEQ